jgi:predicted regulator of Ras-like GTPase activity (Roadblock/LC7/MglB family)
MSLDDHQAKELSGFLSNITTNTELEALALVSKEGLRLAFSAIPEYEIDPDQLCALGAVLLSSGEESVNKMGFTNLVEVVLRGKKSFMVISAAGRFFLIGASRTISDLGKTVTVFRFYAAKIAELYS